MNEWLRSGPQAEHDPDLDAADALLDKADALLRRHHTDDFGPVVALEDEEDENDLPILTDIVDELDAEVPLLDDPVLPEPDEVLEVPAAAAPAGMDLAERLISIDTEVAREVESWLAQELPQLISRELDAFAERLRAEALAHLRATLLPALSERIAAHLESEPPPRR